MQQQWQQSQQSRARARSLDRAGMEDAAADGDALMLALPPPPPPPGALAHGVAEGAESQWAFIGTDLVLKLATGLRVRDLVVMASVCRAWRMARAAHAARRRRGTDANAHSASERVWARSPASPAGAAGGDRAMGGADVVAR